MKIRPQAPDSVRSSCFPEPILEDESGVTETIQFDGGRCA